jgi:diguanylate cyclase (GGDEF)-like protein
MDIQKYRSEFVIYIVDADTKTNSRLKEILVGVNYQVETFATAELILNHVREAPPHIIFTGADLEFINQIKKLSSDIEVVFFGKKTDGIESIKRGAFTFIEKPFSEAELLSTADRLVEHIFLRLQNEQLIEELNQKAPTNVSAGSDYVTHIIEKTSNLDDPDRVAKFLAEEMSHVAQQRPVIFLKYLSLHQSLTVTASAQIPLDEIRNVGIKLDHYDEKNISFLLGEPEKFKELKELMLELFKCPHFSAFPLRVDGKVAGLFVVFADMKGREETLNKILAVGALGYHNAVLNTKVRDLATRDPLTGLYNRRYFNEKLDEEMNRARRTHYPLALIHLDIDNLKKYNDAHGHLMGDVIIKSVGQIILKTSRKTDIAVRLGGTEFAVLCTATAGVGAAIKAEKIRLTVEATKFPHSDTQPLGKITISAGVSEYPTIVSDSLGLFRAADDALFKVKQGGRNRVCLSEAPTNFKPDFEPLPIPGFQALPPNQIQT